MTSASSAPIIAERTAVPSKSSAAFRTITEVAADLGLETHVLRFWESKFPRIKPVKLRGGRRYYRPQDVALLQEIKELLYTKGFTIKGAQKALGKQRPIAIITDHADSKIIEQTVDQVFATANQNSEAPGITAAVLEKQIHAAVAAATERLARAHQGERAELAAKLQRTEAHLLASQNAYADMRRALRDVVGDITSARDAARRFRQP